MIKERIIQLLEYKSIPKENFYKKIGMTSASFRGEAKKSPLNSVAIENILSEISDVSPDWLLTGEGPVLRSDLPAASPAAPGSGIPLIPIDAMAGFGTGDTQVLDYECDRYVVPVFRDAEFLISVKGSSMYPKYNSGDIVACKKLDINDIFFQWNKVYVLDTEQGALIKRVKPAPEQGSILVISDNPKYDPFTLRLDQIHAIAIVIGVIRLE